MFFCYFKESLSASYFWFTMYGELLSSRILNKLKFWRVKKMWMFMDVKIERRRRKRTRVVFTICWVGGIEFREVPPFDRTCLSQSKRLSRSNWGCGLQQTCPVRLRSTKRPLAPSGPSPFNDYLVEWLLSYSLTLNMLNYYTLKYIQTSCKNEYGEIECKSHANIIQTSVYKIIYVNNSKGF